MKKIVFGLFICFFLALPAISFGATGWYGSVNAGVGIVPDSDADLTVQGLGTISAEISYDTGFTVGGAVGYMMEYFRVEGEISYQANDVDSISISGLGSAPANGDVSALTFLVNGYYDFATGGPLTPYITAGLGFSNVEADSGGVSEDDNLFTYQLGVGVGYAISETVTLDLRYRYLGFEDFESSGYDPDFAANYTEKVEISSHNITAGLRFAF